MANTACRHRQWKEPVKTCFLPTCLHDDVENPGMRFFTVRKELKESWCLMVGRKCPIRPLFCCEDHINVEEDLENYERWIYGAKPRLKLNAIPKNIPKDIQHSDKGAPGPAGSSSSGTPLPGPRYLDSKLEDPLATAPPHTTDTTPQCRFCAEFSKDCVQVTNKDRPYLTRNKTALTISDLSVELDFNDALPKTVCRACDSKLLEMFKFVKQVKEAQHSLINVRDYVIEVDTVVKTECKSPTPDVDDIDSKDDIVDSLTVTDTVFVKPYKPIIKHKRKCVEGAKTHKKPKVTKDVESEEVEFIIIEIKEENAESDEMVERYETENVEIDVTAMDTKPSELELQTLLKLMK